MIDESVHAAPPLRLHLLGGFRVERGGQPLPPSAWQKRAAARTLVKVLALAPSHRLHREQLLDLLWPEADPDSALNSFGKALHAARHALEPNLPHRAASAYLHLIDDVVALDPTRAWIDVDEFTRRAQAAVGGHDQSMLEAALAVYGGELLPEDRYAEWADARREELAARHLQVLLRLASLCEQQGAYAAAVERLQQVLQQDPTREETHRGLMRLYLRLGSRHQALRQYQQCCRVLREEVDAVPEAATEALHQQILAARHREIEQAPEQEARARQEVRPAALPAILQRVPATALVGREHVLALALQAVDQAGPGQGNVLLVGGEAGVGKTRLVAEAARAAHRQGTLVLWGGSYEADSLRAYGPFVEALESYLLDRPAEERRTLATAYPDLRLLLPALDAAGAAPLPAGLEGQHTRLFAAVARLLDDLAAARPLLLVLDDLHLADVASIQLLGHLSRLAPRRRWVLMGTYREEDVQTGSAFASLCSTLTRAELCRRVDLRRLARADSDRLVAALLPEAVAEPALLEQFYSLSLGNPLFLQEIVRMLQEQGNLTVEQGRWRMHEATARSRRTATHTGVPRQVRDLVEARVQRLGPAVQGALELAAVAGEDVPFRVLQDAGASDEGVLLTALDRALEARLLDEGAEGYVFRHPLFRAALYEGLSRQRRVRLHDAVARALERYQPEKVEALAYHYVHAEDDEKAILYLERAADHARDVYANEAALASYGEARARLERAGAAMATLARLDEKLGDVRLRVGELAAAQSHFAQARAAETDCVRRARLWRKEGESWEKQGEYDRALHAYEEGLNEDSQGGDALPNTFRALLTLSCAGIYSRQGDYGRAETAARQAMVLAGEEPEGEIMARALYLRGLVAWQRGVLAEAETHLRQSVLLVEKAGDTTRVAATLSSLGNVAHDRGDYAEAIRYHRQSLDIYERMGEQGGMAQCWLNLGVVFYTQGACREAEECYRRSLDIYERIGAQLGVATCWNNLGETLECRGDFAGAEEAYRQALSLFEHIGDPRCTAHAWSSLGSLAIGQGDLTRAEEYYRRSLTLREGLGDQRGAADSWTGLGEIACEKGDLISAMHLCRRGRRLAVRSGAADMVARAAFGQARAHLRRLLLEMRTGSAAVRPTRRRFRTIDALITYGRTLTTQHGLGRGSVHAALLVAELHVQTMSAQAYAAAEEALHLATNRQMRPEEAVARRLLGQCASARHEPAVAEAHLRTALAMQLEFGAALEAARTRVALAGVLLAQACQAGTAERRGPHAPEWSTLLAEAQAQFVTSGAALDLAQANESLAAHRAPAATSTWRGRSSPKETYLV